MYLVGFFAGLKSSVLKSRDIILPTKVCISQGYGLPSGHRGLQTMVLKKAPESPLDSKEIKPVNLKGGQPWIFTGRTDAEADAQVLWSFDANRLLIGEDPGAGKEWGQKEKRVSEDAMAGRHHWCSEHELGQTLGDGEGQGGLACCSPWGRKESDMTGQLNNNKIFIEVNLGP